MWYLPLYLMFALLSQKWQCLQLWEKPNVKRHAHARVRARVCVCNLFFFNGRGKVCHISFRSWEGGVAERAPGIQKIEILILDWLFVLLCDNEPISYLTLFSSLNLQSQNFSTRKFFRSHQDPTLLACDYLGHETQKNTVLPHCPTSGTYVGFCEDQNE